MDAALTTKHHCSRLKQTETTVTDCNAQACLRPACCAALRQELSLHSELVCVRLRDSGLHRLAALRELRIALPGRVCHETPDPFGADLQYLVDQVWMCGCSNKGRCGGCSAWWTKWGCVDKYRVEGGSGMHACVCACRACWAGFATQCAHSSRPRLRTCAFAREAQVPGQLVGLTLCRMERPEPGCEQRIVDALKRCGLRELTLQLADRLTPE
eukprot:354283-Chlamydomonas_euryale.AAC.7